VKDKCGGGSGEGVQLKSWRKRKYAECSVPRDAGTKKERRRCEGRRIPHTFFFANFFSVERLAGARAVKGVQFLRVRDPEPMPARVLVKCFFICLCTHLADFLRFFYKTERLVLKNPNYGF